MTTWRRCLWLIFAILPVMNSAAAGEKTYQDYWDEALQKPHKLSESVNCTELVTADAIYLFTKPNNPDHPALFIRKIQYREGKMYMVTEGHSFRSDASKPSLQSWMDHPFDEVHNR